MQYPRVGKRFRMPALEDSARLIKDVGALLLLDSLWVLGRSEGDGHPMDPSSFSDEELSRLIENSRNSLAEGEADDTEALLRVLQ